MRAYYNENDPDAAAWLRNLIDAELIMKGDVDARSIADVSPDDIRGYTRCHFFAGIGIWDLALQYAGWPADREVWSGSCPCQPFSAAGKGKGKKDARHLWPDFYRLIDARRPDCVIGEQVPRAIRNGWLDDLCDDMEASNYTTWTTLLPACGIGSPIIRQRIFWVSFADGGTNKCPRQAPSLNENRSQTVPERTRLRIEPTGNCSFSFAECDWLQFGDGKTRPIKSGLECLVDGIAFRLADGRTGRQTQSRAKILKAIGNAIVPDVAAAFIRGFVDTLNPQTGL